MAIILLYVGIVYKNYLEYGCVVCRKKLSVAAIGQFLHYQ